MMSGSIQAAEDEDEAAHCGLNTRSLHCSSQLLRSA